MYAFARVCVFLSLGLSCWCFCVFFLWLCQYCYAVCVYDNKCTASYLACAACRWRTSKSNVNTKRSLSTERAQCTQMNRETKLNSVGAQRPLASTSERTQAGRSKSKQSVTELLSQALIEYFSVIRRHRDACTSCVDITVFSYASSSTLYSGQWESRWAEFRTSVAWSLRDC